MIKILHYLTILLTSIWIIIGVLTIGSIYLSTIGWAINLVMGIVFISIALFLYFKEISFINLAKNSHKQDTLKKALIYEIISILFLLTIAIGILSAIYFRIFDEGFAVFG